MVNKTLATLLILVFSSLSFAQIRLCDHGLTKTIVRYADGAIQAEGYYKNDFKTGKWIHYYKNGSKESTRYYDRKGTPKGKWTYWYEDGQKWNTVVYNKGEVHGQWTYWYKNGNKWHQLSYTKGDVLGKWTFWLEDGSRNDSGRYDPDTVDKG